MKIRQNLRANPSLWSAIGALMIFLAWGLNAIVVDRLSEITRQIESLDQQEFVNKSLDSLNRKLNNLARELSDVGANHFENELDSSVNRVSARLRERRALEESYQDLQRYAHNLAASVNNAAEKPKDLYPRVAETHNKIRDAVQRYAEVYTQFGNPEFHLSTPEGKQDYIAENSAYLKKADDAASFDLMISLSNELSKEEGELLYTMRSQRDARERESKLGNIVSIFLFALGTCLTIYCQWVKDSAEAPYSAKSAI